MIPPLRFIVDGEPSTDHRPRCTCPRGKPHLRQSTSYKKWKSACKVSAETALRAWSEENGPWPFGRTMLYAVRTYAITAKGRKDADNAGRGLRDACQGLLWRSDQRCRPVVDDIGHLDELDEAPPGMMVEVIAYDRRKTLVTVELVLREQGP